MHERRQLTAAFGAWQLHSSCQQRLALLAERLAAAIASRRIRAAFNAWADLVLAPTLAPQQGGRVSFTSCVIQTGTAHCNLTHFEDLCALALQSHDIIYNAVNRRALWR